MEALAAVPGGRTGTCLRPSAHRHEDRKRNEKPGSKSRATIHSTDRGSRRPPLRTCQTRPRRAGSDRAQVPPSGARRLRQSPGRTKRPAVSLAGSQPAPGRATPAPCSSRAVGSGQKEEHRRGGRQHESSTAARGQSMTWFTPGRIPVGRWAGSAWTRRRSILATTSMKRCGGNSISPLKKGWP